MTFGVNVDLRMGFVSTYSHVLNNALKKDL